MPSNNITQMRTLIELTLKSDERLWTKTETADQPELNQTKLLDLIEKTDERIITLLFKQEDLRAKFFVKIDASHVFKTNDFRFFMEQNKINNSYTDYKNRIGLTDGRRFLKDTQDVVLNFPFKDGILQGGQSTEEGEDTYFATDKEGQYKPRKAKRKEIFFNQIIAHDEIDRLLERKALVNWKRHTKEGMQQVQALKRDANGMLKENLIIKGNSLLALHSLKPQFAGKVKLIYIDPPYNTGGDANIFTYNNNFNHSTWLTFMKNRLEAAQCLLRDDGFIAIAIDHNELFYLGTLADEIFGRDNRLGIISIAHKPGGVQFAKLFNTSNDFSIVYAKNKKKASFEKVVLDDSAEKKFDKVDDLGKYKEEKFMRDFDPDATKEKKPIYWYPIYVSQDLVDLSLDDKDGYTKILPISTTQREVTWNQKKETFLKNFNANEVFAKLDNGKINIMRKVRASQPIKTLWTATRYDATSSGTKLLKKTLGYKSNFSYPKSLYTVLDTLKIMTGKNDIILDFFTGSGTTGHATLALNKEDGGNRKFILVEQIDKHIEVCKERIQKVMRQGNIDDSLIYCELAEWNEQAKRKIEACQSLAELEKLFNTLYKKYFLNYNLKLKEFKEKVLKEPAFRKLSLPEHQKIFVAMLDNNQMYTCKSEMADSKYNIDSADQTLTTQFYNNE